MSFCEHGVTRTPKFIFFGLNLFYNSHMYLCDLLDEFLFELLFLFAWLSLPHTHGYSCVCDDVECVKKTGLFQLG